MYIISQTPTRTTSCIPTKACLGPSDESSKKARFLPEPGIAPIRTLDNEVACNLLPSCKVKLPILNKLQRLSSAFAEEAQQILPVKLSAPELAPITFKIGEASRGHWEKSEPTRFLYQSS